MCVFKVKPYKISCEFLVINFIYIDLGRDIEGQNREIRVEGRTIFLVIGRLAISYLLFWPDGIGTAAGMEVAHLGSGDDAGFGNEKKGLYYQQNPAIKSSKTWYAHEGLGLTMSRFKFVLPVCRRILLKLVLV